jgi:Trypsin
MRMRNKKIFSVTLLVASVIVVSLFAGTVEAITNGVPDGNDHPYVCLIVFDVAGTPTWRGSGIVLSPTVVLTAGHCTYGSEKARVWIDEVVQGNPEYPFSGATSYDGIPITNPGYAQAFWPGLNGFITHDVGIVILTEPIPSSALSTYGSLPTAGQTDTLEVGTNVDFVGYGVQENLRGGGQPVWTGLKNRFYAPGQILSKNFAISNEFLRCSANPGQGKGGTAFGDSGGPVLLAGTSKVLAVTSFGTNNNCAGNGYYFRIDQPQILSWINSYLP